MKLCWLCQKLISRRSEAVEPAPAWLRHHLSRCETCREFRDGQRHLTLSLTEHALAHVASPSQFLHGKIMAALDRDAALPESANNVFALWRRLAIPAFGVLVVLIIWLRNSLPQSHDAPFPMTTSSVASGASEKNSNAGENFLTWGKNLNQPLETELYLVASDARTALASLTETFLPRAYNAEAR